MTSPDHDPAAELRRVWAASLARHMGDMPQAELKLRLAEKGVAVSRQAITNWLDGTASPSAHRMGALAAIFDTTVAELFPIERAA